MAQGRSIVINGDLGSGKSTVSGLLAQRLGVRRISIGDLYRELASQRGMSALQLNLHAELDEKIDHYVDQLQREIAGSGEQLVVDSRLAWHFFTDALKVHLITDPTVAAQRVLGRPTPVEQYADLEEALAQLASRSESERLRFLTSYGVDKTRLRNYDVVLDTTRAAPPEVVERIIEHVQAPGSESGTVCHLDPQQIRPAKPRPDQAEDPADGEVPQPLAVGYAAPDFFAVRGQQHLSAAVRSGQTLVRAALVAEGPDGEQIRPGGEADVAAVLGLLDAATRWLVGRGRVGQWGTEPHSTNPRRIEAVTAWAREGGLYLAYLGGEPVGALAVGDAPSYVPPAVQPELYVNLLVTSRAHTGQRIGRRLLAHARQIARQRNLDLLRVDCYAGDDRALVRYYEGEGFTATDPFEVDLATGTWPGQVLQQHLSRP